MELHTTMNRIKVSIHKPRAERLLESIRSGKISFIRSLLSQGYSPNGDSPDSKVKHPLDLAIELGNHEIVLLLIEFGTNLDLPVLPSKKQIALHRAVIRGNMKIIMTILEKTVNWQVPDVDGATVMHLAIESRENNQIEILKVFLDLGMDVNVKTLKGETPVFTAGKGHLREVIDFLIKRGADVNIQDCSGDSLIHYFLKYKSGFGELACTNARANKQTYSNVDFIEWLISKGVDVDRKNKAGQSPFELALQYPMASALLMLLKYVRGSLNFNDEKSRTILHSVLEFNSCKLSYQDVRGYRSPHKDSQVEAVVEILISEGIPVNAVDCEGNSVLHVAVNKKTFFIIPKLLEHLADVNARNNQGETAMYLLIKNSEMNEDGLEDTLRVLLAKGAEMNLLSNDGLSPVHLAAKMKHVLVLKMFKEKGADLKASTSNLENLWHMFASNTCNEKANKDMIEFLAKEDLDINATSLSGSTPLHVALNNCNFYIVQQLVKNGADVNLREKSSQLMPIHIALQKNSTAIVNFLLTAGADVNAKVFSLSTLHLAAQNCGRSIIKILTCLGADVDAIDEENRTPLDYVICNKNFEAFVYFLEIGVPNCFNVPLETFSNWSHADKDVLEYMTKYECIDMPFRNLWGTLYSDSFSTKEKQLLDVLKEKLIKKADKMRAICHDTSLYDFLRMSLRRRTFYVKQGHLAKFVYSPDLRHKHPMYHDMIIYKYREALTRNSLLITAKDSFCRLTNSSLPDLCIENIFDYLDNYTLKILIKVNNVSQCDSIFEDEVRKLYQVCKKDLHYILMSADSEKDYFNDKKITSIM